MVSDDLGRFILAPPSFKCNKTFTLKACYDAAFARRTVLATLTDAGVNHRGSLFQS